MLVEIFFIKDIVTCIISALYLALHELQIIKQLNARNNKVLVDC